MSAPAEAPKLRGLWHPTLLHRRAAVRARLLAPWHWPTWLGIGLLWLLAMLITDCP